MSTPKTILVFGAGDNQLLLIKACRELGYRTLATDPSPEAPGAALADEYFVLPPKDLDAHRKLIREAGVQGIVTCQMENPLPLMAQLAAEFGFPFPSPETIARSRNKFLMKQAFQAGGAPCARGFLVKNREQLDALQLESWTFPLIIKPLDSYSSRGVRRVESQAELVRYFPEAVHFSSDGAVLIEEFLEGPEVSVESITFQGKTTIVQITDKEITPYPFAVELGHRQPSALPGDTLAEIEEVVKSAVAAVGIDNSGSHAELKITPDGVKMVEIGARLGGDYISSYLTQLSTGVDMNRAIAQVAMGEAPDLQPSRQRYSGIRYVNWETGREVVRVTPPDSLFADADLAHAGIFVKPGELLPAVTESTNRHAFVITSGATRAQLEENLERLSRKMIELVETRPSAKTQEVSAGDEEGANASTL